MGLIADIFTATAQTPMAPPPVHERLAAQLAEAEREIPALTAAHREANFTHEAGPPSPETAANLAQATSALADGRARVASLRDALLVAQERAAVRAERERAARFAKSQKALAVHLRTRDHHMKAAAGHLQSYVKHWHEAINATGQVQTALGGMGLRQPMGAMLSVTEMKTVIENELHRLNGELDPDRSAQPGYALMPPGARSHDLSTRFNGRFLPDMPAVLREKTAYTLRWLAGRETMVKEPTEPAPSNRLPSVVYEPADPARLPNQVKAADIDAAALAEAKRQWAELIVPTKPEPWDPTDPDQLKAEWAAVQNPADRIDPDSYDEGEPADTGLSNLDALISPDLKEPTQ